MDNSVIIVSVKWKQKNSTYGKAIFQNGKMIECTMIPMKFKDLDNLALKLADSLGTCLKYHAHVFSGHIDWGLVVSEVNKSGVIDFKLHA